MIKSVDLMQKSTQLEADLGQSKRVIESNKMQL